MNPLTNVRNVAKLNEQDLRNGIFEHTKTWHSQYKDSAYIFIGGLPYDLTEGDILCVFSQYGEIVNINLVRDKKSGKSKGYGFLCYEDQRSTVLVVDNLNGIKLGGRTIRVDHVSEYRTPKSDEKGEDGKLKDKIEAGCAPKTPSPVPSDDDKDGLLDNKSDKKKKKKEKKKKRKKKKGSNVSGTDTNDSDGGSDDGKLKSYRDDRDYKLSKDIKSSKRDTKDYIRDSGRYASDTRKDKDNKNCFDKSRRRSLSRSPSLERKPSKWDISSSVDRKQRRRNLSRSPSVERKSRKRDILRSPSVDRKQRRKDRSRSPSVEKKKRRRDASRSPSINNKQRRRDRSTSRDEKRKQRDRSYSPDRRRNRSQSQDRYRSRNDNHSRR